MCLNKKNNVSTRTLSVTFGFRWHDYGSHRWWYRCLSCQISCFCHWTHWCFSSPYLFPEIKHWVPNVLGQISHLSISADKSVLVELDKVICFTVDSDGNRQTWKTGGSISKSFCIVSRFLTSWSFNPKSTITLTQCRIASKTNSHFSDGYIFWNLPWSRRLQSAGFTDLILGSQIKSNIGSCFTISSAQKFDFWSFKNTLQKCMYFYKCFILKLALVWISTLSRIIVRRFRLSFCFLKLSKDVFGILKLSKIEPFWAKSRCRAKN